MTEASNGSILTFKEEGDIEKKGRRYEGTDKGRRRRNWFIFLQ